MIEAPFHKKWFKLWRNPNCLDSQHCVYLELTLYGKKQPYPIALLENQFRAEISQRIMTRAFSMETMKKCVPPFGGTWLEMKAPVWNETDRLCTCTKWRWFTKPYSLQTWKRCQSPEALLLASLYYCFSVVVTRNYHPQGRRPNQEERPQLARLRDLTCWSLVCCEVHGETACCLIIALFFPG